MMKNAVVCFFVLMFLCVCMVSCMGDSTQTPAVTQPTVTEAAPMAHRTESVETYLQTETEPAAETQSVPSVPYTLKQTVTEISDQIPNNLMNTGGIYTETGDISYRNTFVINDKLYIYYGIIDESKRQEMIALYADNGIDVHDDSMIYWGDVVTTNLAAGYLRVFENGVPIEEIPVPLVNGILPYYAYPLSENRFAVLLCVKTETIQSRRVAHCVFSVVEADGTVLAEMALEEADPDFWSNGDFVIRETENGIVRLLHRGEYSRIFSIDYDPETNTMSTGRMVYTNVNGAFKHIAVMEYIGNNTWFPMYKADELSILDMQAGLYKDMKFRVPEDKDHMSVIVDRQGQYYLFDKMGMYTYQDNLPPVKVADWIECGISPDLYFRNLWIIDEQNFYISRTITINKQTTHHLYYIHTERVPDEHPKQVITFDYYGYSEWLMDTVVAFNRESEDYEIKFNEIDVVGMGAEEISALLAERTLYQAHPDLVMTAMKIPLEDYYSKNVFLDLAPYFGDALLGCVTDAGGYGDALYAIPTEMQIRTFLCLDDVTDTYLTWDRFLATIAELQPGEVLLSEDSAIPFLYNNGIMDFFDRAAGTASYDSERFRQVIQLLETLDSYVDETVGYVKGNSDRTSGYTNTTMPARLREGGLTYLDLIVDSPEMLVIAKLLFGEEDFTWCGYPSKQGGGAFINLLSRISVFADTDVKEGCLAFLEFLLSDERQTAANRSDLPVTVSAMRKILQKNRYWCYSAETYLAIGDPAAELRLPGVTLGGNEPVGSVSLSAQYVSETPVTFPVDEDGMPTGYAVELTDADINAFLAFLDDCHMTAGSDDTVERIVKEELSYWQNGIKSLEETTKVIQSRVGIYLAEQN